MLDMLKSPFISTVNAKSLVSLSTCALFLHPFACISLDIPVSCVAPAAKSSHPDWWSFSSPAGWGFKNPDLSHLSVRSFYMQHGGRIMSFLTLLAQIYADFFFV